MPVDEGDVNKRRERRLLNVPHLSDIYLPDILCSRRFLAVLWSKDLPPPYHPPIPSPHFNVTGIELVQSSPGSKFEIVPSQAAAISRLLLYYGDRRMATAIDSDVLIERVGATYLCKVGN